jgi:hypothetical protein
VRKAASSELWVAELDSGRSEPLLPGIALTTPGAGALGGYDISPDGRQIVLASPDSAGKVRLWLSPLDRRLPPRQIPNVEGEQPLFGATGEVFFRRLEGTTAFVYRVQQDGGELRKAIDLSVVGMLGASPDRNWLVIGSGHASGGNLVFRVDGGAPFKTKFLGPITLGWSGDGKHLFVQERERAGKAYVFPLAPGQPVPESILHGLPSEQEILKLPGVRMIALDDVVPGATADIYAYRRESVQRNLYRVPLP